MSTAVMPGAEEWHALAPGAARKATGRPPRGPRLYLIINGMVTEADDSPEAFSVPPAVEVAYEFLSTHNGIVSAAMILQTLLTVHDASQRDTTVAVAHALKGRPSLR